MVGDPRRKGRSARLVGARRTWLPLLLGAVLLLAPGSRSGTTGSVAAPAVGPRMWVQSSFADLRGGELRATSLGSAGEITLAPTLELLHDTGTPYVWAAAAAADGRAWYAVGDEGDVWTLGPDGATEEFFSLRGDPQVHAMALGPDGHLYASSSPGGFVWRVPVEGGESVSREPWYQPQQRYAWSLAFGPAGELYVGTGPQGIIHAVGTDGEGGPLYDSDEKHVTALAVDGEGNVLVGTEEGGQVLRISPSAGEDPPGVFVLYDSPLRQVTDIVVGEAGLFVGGIGPAAPSEDGSTGQAAPTTTAEAAGSPASAAAPDDAEDLAGAVYLIHQDGYVETLWTSDSEAVHAMAADEGGVVVGTGPDGRLLRLSAAGDVTLLHRVEAAQVTDLVRIGGGALLISTANLGRLYRLGGGFGEPSEEGAVAGGYTSTVLDTGTTSRWGRIRWRARTPAGTDIRLYTRSGNTETPDTTWSQWAGPYDEPGGSPVESEPARFVQWKAELSADDGSRTPTLQRVELVYVQRNLRPRIEEFDVHPGGVVYRPSQNFEETLPFGQVPPSVQAELDRQDGRQATSTTASTFRGRPFFVAGQRTFTWSATDPNGDRLSYTLSYRAESETTWKTVVTRLAENMVAWDTTTVPDGYYQARITASDAGSNPEGRALEGHRVSDVFLIDNTPPGVVDLSAELQEGRVRVRGRAVDDSGLILRLEYAVDGGDWNAVVPADGLADAATETIDFTTGPLAAGEHTIVVRASDTSLNSGAERTTIVVR